MTNTCACAQEGYIKEPITHNTWDALLKLYEEAVEERKHMPEAQLAMTLFIENERVPLPTEVHRNRNANPLPVSTLFSEKNASHWQPMVERLVPRMAAWAGRWVIQYEGRAHRAMKMRRCLHSCKWTSSSLLAMIPTFGLYYRTDIDPLVTRGLRRYYDGSMLRDHVDGCKRLIGWGEACILGWFEFLLDADNSQRLPKVVWLFPLPIIQRATSRRSSTWRRRPLTHGICTSSITRAAAIG